jgi:hypothetical protein
MGSYRLSETKQIQVHDLATEHQVAAKTESHEQRTEAESGNQRQRHKTCAREWEDWSQSEAWARSPAWENN